MPQIMIKGTTPEMMDRICRPMIRQLSEIIGCPEDWLTLEYCPSQFYTAQGAAPHYPVVQVWWFERPAPVREATARAISRIFLQEGCPMVQVSFHLFEKEGYYEMKPEGRSE